MAEAGADLRAALDHPGCVLLRSQGQPCGAATPPGDPGSDPPRCSRPWEKGSEGSQGIWWGVPDGVRFSCHENQTCSGDQHGGAQGGAGLGRGWCGGAGRSGSCFREIDFLDQRCWEQELPAQRSPAPDLSGAVGRARHQVEPGGGSEAARRTCHPAA